MAQALTPGRNPVITYYDLNKAKIELNEAEVKAMDADALRQKLALVEGSFPYMLLVPIKEALKWVSDNIWAAEQIFISINESPNPDKKKLDLLTGFLDLSHKHFSFLMELLEPGSHHGRPSGHP